MVFVLMINSKYYNFLDSQECRLGVLAAGIAKIFITMTTASSGQVENVKL
jgi:hypothetical protein